MTLTWGGYVVGLLCSLFGYLYLRYTDPSYNQGGTYTPAILFYAFIIGLQCCAYSSSLRVAVITIADERILLFIALTMTSALEAGVSTM